MWHISRAGSYPEFGLFLTLGQAFFTYFFDQKLNYKFLWIFIFIDKILAQVNKWSITLLKNNLPILILLIIVIGSYSLAENSIFVRKPSVLESECYGIDIPDSIKANKTRYFCSCVRMGGHVSKEENYKYCVNQLTDKENQNSLRRLCENTPSTSCTNYD